MLFWLVMYINGAMFSPIVGEARTFLQFLSFMELFVEISLIVMFVGFKINNHIDNRSRR